MIKFLTQELNAKYKRVIFEVRRSLSYATFRVEEENITISSILYSTCSASSR